MKNTGKQTIVLVPGWLHDFKNERLFIEKLSEYFNIVTFTYPGYYNEKELGKIPSKYTLSDLLYLKVKKLKLKDYYLLGFSMGCQVVLHLLNKYNLKNKVVLISPTMESLDSQTPFVLKMFLKNQIFFNMVRKSEALAKIIVDIAYRKISRITENKDSKGMHYNNKNITAKGAFDTLYFIATNFIDPRKYTKQTSFIFGEKEVLQKNFKNKYESIKDMGHGRFKTHTNDIIEAIIKHLC